MRLDCNVHVFSYIRKKLDPEFTVLPKKGALGLEAGDYRFVYTYPLSKPAEFVHRLSGKTSARSILTQAARDYRKIYAAENDPGYIPGMMNRSQSDGPYGIWGHYLRDLYFEGIEISTKRKTVKFSMGS